MAIIQPDSELMKHNYFHYAYLTQTENYSERGRTGGVCVYKIYTLYCIHVLYMRQRDMRDMRWEGKERGGSAKKVGG